MTNASISQADHTAALETLSYAPQPQASLMAYTQPSAPPMSPSYAPLTTANLTSEYIPQYDPVTTEDLDTAGLGLDYFGGGTRYTYQTTPSVNKLQIEPSPPTTPRLVGPVMRAKSAPGNQSIEYIYTIVHLFSLVQWKTFEFKEMFYCASCTLVSNCNDIK